MLKSLTSLSVELAKIPDVAAVILFGSAARGEAGPKSDIDLLVIVERSAAKTRVEKVVAADRRWERVVPTVITPKKLAETPHFLFDILRDGVVLYKNPCSDISIPFAMRSRGETAFILELKGTPQAARVRLNAALYGATHRRKLMGGRRAKYEYTGFLARVGGRRLGAGAFLVPAKAEAEAEELLSFHGMRFGKLHFILVEGG